MGVDPVLARQWLSYVSYYRLSGYWYPARLVNESGERLDVFKPGTKFDDAVALYEADRKLRTLVHDGMERIEIALRTKLIEYLCCQGSSDPLAYLDPSIFRPNFRHSSWVETVNRRLRRQSDNPAVKHYADNYGGNYPFWVVAEVVDFSDMSRLYAGLRTTGQYEVAENFSICIDPSSLSKTLKRKIHKRHPLARWLEQLTIVRNTCAHHGRLWNKSFVPAPTDALRTSSSFALLPPIQNERIFGALVVMAHLLTIVSPGTNWPEKVVNLLNDDFLVNDLVACGSLGIPEDWDRQKLAGMLNH